MPVIEAPRGAAGYTDMGAGPGAPLLLVHGSASSRRSWGALLPALAASRRVLAPDLVGYDGAGSFDTGTFGGIGAECDRLLAVLDHAGVARAHLAGHSYGGAVAIAFAERHPERVLTLTAMEPVMFRLLAGDPGSAAEWEEVSGVARGHMERVRAGDLAGAAAVFFGHWLGEAAWRAVAGPQREALLACMPKVAAEWSLLFEGGTAGHRAPDLRMPLLLMRGTATTRPAARVVELLCRQWPDARLEEVAGAGHLLPYTHPGQAARAMAALMEPAEAAAA